MEKLTLKLWIYGFNFLLRSIIFNTAIVFSIIAIVKHNDGFTIWAIISTALASSWVFMHIVDHTLWLFMSQNERAMYFTLRRHGSKSVRVTKKEISRKTGQKDLVEILRDEDSSLEVQMAINGTATLINVMIGIRWLYHAIKFNNSPEEFDFEIVDKY